MYKLPRLQDARSQTVQEGSGYVYMDINHESFQLSSKAAGNNDSAMGRTLEQIYSNSPSRRNSMAYILYNDENPDGKNFYNIPKFTSRATLKFLRTCSDIDFCAGQKFPIQTRYKCSPRS